MSSINYQKINSFFPNSSKKNLVPHCYLSILFFCFLYFMDHNRKCRKFTLHWVSFTESAIQQNRWMNQFERKSVVTRLTFTDFDKTEKQIESSVKDRSLKSSAGNDAFESKIKECHCRAGNTFSLQSQLLPEFPLLSQPSDCFLPLGKLGTLTMAGNLIFRGQKEIWNPVFISGFSLW